MNAAAGTATSRPSHDETINDVLTRFLADEQKRLGTSTFVQYCRVIGFLRSCLENYGYLALGDEDRALFERCNKPGSNGRRGFCRIFSPAQILPSTGEFLGYYMVHKVITAKQTVLISPTVVRRLAQWLERHGHVTAKEARSAMSGASMYAVELRWLESAA